MVTKKIPERKITTVKLGRKEWQEQLRKSIQQQHQKDHKIERKERRERAKRAKKYVPIPIVIGTIASIVMWKEFSGAILLETVLNWVIGITIVSTLMAATKRL